MDSGNAHTPALDRETVPKPQPEDSPTTSTLLPKRPKTRRIQSTDVAETLCPDVNTAPSAYNLVQSLLVEPSSKKSSNNSIHFCECHRQDDTYEEQAHGRDETDDSTDDDDDDDDDYEAKRKRKPSKFVSLCNRYCCDYLTKLRRIIAAFVASKYFRRIVLSAIVVNTLSMGIEYHGQPQSLTNALEYSNLVFTCLFAIEMVLKLIAEGFLPYIRNGYNLFDGGIVIMSVVELQGNKNSGLSVLRTFRLLRVLKLVRFMPTLRRQLVSENMESSLSETRALSSFHC